MNFFEINLKHALIGKGIYSKKIKLLLTQTGLYEYIMSILIITTENAEKNFYLLGGTGNYKAINHFVVKLTITTFRRNEFFCSMAVSPLNKK